MKNYNSIDEIKAANRAAGQHFFSPDTMRFFKSRVLDGVINGCMFITSEKHESHNYKCPRMYSVRLAKEDGSIQTLYDFNSFSTAAQARSAAKFLPNMQEVFTVLSRTWDKTKRERERGLKKAIKMLANNEAMKHAYVNREELNIKTAFCILEGTLKEIDS